MYFAERRIDVLEPRTRNEPFIGYPLEAGAEHPVYFLLDLVERRKRRVSRFGHEGVMLACGIQEPRCA